MVPWCWLLLVKVAPPRRLIVVQSGGGVRIEELGQEMGTLAPVVGLGEPKQNKGNDNDKNNVH